MEGEKATVIDAAAEIEGKLLGKNARILGRFKGEVELQGNLVLGEGSRVEATAVADSAEIAGNFEGDLVVKRLVLLEKAHISGSVDAQSLSVREGAVVNGTVSAGPPETRKPKPEAKDAPKPLEGAPKVGPGMPPKPVPQLAPATPKGPESAGAKPDPGKGPASE
jgi:cytoskeletal protein CcmA (bactofilin family)